MPVKVAKLFKSSRFSRLHDKAKLLYIYLATHPSLNSVGVFSPNIEVAMIESGLAISEFRVYVLLLIRENFIHVKSYDKIPYFIVPAHFNTMPKSTATVTRVNKDLKSLPDELVTFLGTIGITITSKIRDFVKPTTQEVSNYAMEQGHKVDGQEFIEYYERMSNTYGKKNIWVDGRGTEVRDWKAKLRRIWCKDENKIKTVDGAPKGFESFHVVTDTGKQLYPEEWKDDKPWSRNVGSDILLKREFNKLK